MGTLIALKDSAEHRAGDTTLVRGDASKRIEIDDSGAYAEALPSMMLARQQSVGELRGRLGTSHGNGTAEKLDEALSAPDSFALHEPRERITEGTGLRDAAIPYRLRAAAAQVFMDASGYPRQWLLDWEEDLHCQCCPHTRDHLGLAGGSRDR